MSNNYKDPEIMRLLRNMPRSTLQQKADEFSNKQGLVRYNGIIEHMSSKNNGDPIQFQDHWKPMFWQANGNTAKRTVVIQGKEIPVYDMDFYIAESLQTLQSGQDPEAEYYGWVEQAKVIIKDIKTDGTTLQELHARSDFISFLDDRETELKRVISLYAGAAFNNNCSQQNVAQEKLKFLTFKMSELRKIRERVQSTKPTKPHLKEKQQSIIFSNSRGVIRYDVDEAQSNDEEALNNSAEAVSVASQLSAMHILRYNTMPETLQDVPVEELIHSIDQIQPNTIDTKDLDALERKRQKLREIWKLSGRLKDKEKLHKDKKGFRAKEYQMLRSRRDEYENV